MDARVILFACLCLVARVYGAAYGEACSGAGTGDCVGAHLICTGTPTKCACDTEYVWDTTLQAPACKLKVGQACSDVNNCVSNTVCATTCNCKPGYKTSGDICMATYDSTCAANTDCSTLPNSECSAQKCKCSSGYNYVSATAACSAIIGTTCTEDANCNVNGMTKAECTGSPKACACMNGYEGATCTMTYGKTCGANGDCNKLKYGVCTATKCACSDTSVKQGDVCKLKAGGTCTAGQDLCPEYAACTGTPTKCTCNANYYAENDICKAKNAGATVTVSFLLMLAAFVSVFL